MDMSVVISISISTFLSLTICLSCDCEDESYLFALAELNSLFKISNVANLPVTLKLFFVATSRLYCKGRIGCNRGLNILVVFVSSCGKEVAIVCSLDSLTSELVYSRFVHNSGS